MRKLPLVVGLALVAAVVTGATWLTASGLPLPWRGALTRHAYAELARGRLPALACVPVRTGDTTTAALARTPLPTEGHFRCRGASADSAYEVVLEVKDGWVYAMQRRWWVLPSRGAAFADSVSSALAASHGAPVRCRTGATEPGSTEHRSFLHWGGRDRAYTTELHVASHVLRRAGGERWWGVSIDEHHDPSRCVPA